MVVTYKQTIFIEVICIFQVARYFRVEVLDDFIFGKVSCHDRPDFKAQCNELADELIAAQVRTGAYHQAETKPTAFADFFLNQNRWVILHDRLQQGCIFAAL